MRRVLREIAVLLLVNLAVGAFFVVAVVLTELALWLLGAAPVFD